MIFFFPLSRATICKGKNCYLIVILEFAFLKREIVGVYLLATKVNNSLHRKKLILKEDKPSL